MGKIITLLIALLFTSVAYSTDRDLSDFSQADDQGQFVAPQWLKDWWQNNYNKSIRQQQEQKAQTKAGSTCEEKLELYKEKLKNKPDSDFYKWKVEKWVKRCQKEKK